jgi:hypothetical protein
MALIIEDGTGIAGANSYLDADAVRAYALARGIALPAIPDGEGAIDPILAPMVLAIDFLEGLDYIGIQATSTQGLQWPRYVRPFISGWYDPTYYDPAQYNGNGVPIDSTLWLMPTKIVSCQAQLVIEQINNDIDLFASAAGFNQGGGFVTRRKVDVIEVQYSDKVIPGSPDLPAVMNLLKGLVTLGGGLVTIRV